MKPEETVEASQLFYRCYGYSYTIDSIYYPDRFAQLVMEGKIISAVTITDNEIVGHVGLVRSSADSIVAEAGMAATKPTFRGFGSMKKMVYFLMDVARGAGLEGFTERQSPYHTYSQNRLCLWLQGLCYCTRGYSFRQGLQGNYGQCFSARNSRIFFYPAGTPKASYTVCACTS